MVGRNDDDWLADLLRYRDQEDVVRAVREDLDLSEVAGRELRDSRVLKLLLRASGTDLGVSGSGDISSEQLLDYLLDRCSPGEARDIERELVRDPAGLRRLLKLKSVLDRDAPDNDRRVLNRRMEEQARFHLGEVTVTGTRRALLFAYEPSDEARSLPGPGEAELLEGDLGAVYPFGDSVDALQSSIERLSLGREVGDSLSEYAWKAGTEEPDASQDFSRWLRIFLGQLEGDIEKIRQLAGYLMKFRHSVPERPQTTVQISKLLEQIEQLLGNRLRHVQNGRDQLRKLRDATEAARTERLMAAIEERMPEDKASTSVLINMGTMIMSLERSHRRSRGNMDVRLRDPAGLFPRPDIDVTLVRPGRDFHNETTDGDGLVTLDQKPGKSVLLVETDQTWELGIEARI